MKFVYFLAVFYVLVTVQCEKELTLEDFTIPEVYSREIVNSFLRVPSRQVSNFRQISDRNKGSTVRLMTKLGAVDGILMESYRKGMQYAAFFGMPYAKPPVGDRRFKAPVPATPWDGVYDATFERPSCMQIQGADNQKSEDCLYVNVYTPSWESGKKLKSVMVYIHGGGFIGGSSNFTLYAPDLLVENDVILVTINYRLGALGFLSLQTADIPGNAGLKDQKLALEWIRDNINCFGGDPNSVTIFGESAGSASVSYHILSKASKGLFHRAIMESGTATTPWGLTSPEDAVKTAKKLAKKLGCAVNGQSMIDCLMKASSYRIAEEQEKSLTLTDLVNLKPFAFTPTTEPNVEGAFLTENPIDILSSKTFNQVPVIIGVNSKEGFLILPTLKSLDPLNVGINLISYSLGSFFPPQSKSSLTDREKNYLNSQLRKFYSSIKPVGTFNALKMIDIVTDVAFTVPTHLMASYLTGGSQPVYSYVFTYDGPYGYYKRELKVQEEGVCHGDELGYIFSDPVLKFFVNDSRFAEADRVVNKVTTMWTDFAKTGNPTPRESGVKWEAHQTFKPNHAEIGKEFRTGSELSAGLERRYRFWENLILEITNSKK